MNTLCIILTWYYTIILAWALIYLVNSFSSTLPWTQCDPSWSDVICVEPTGLKQTPSNVSLLYDVTNSTSNATTVTSNSSGIFEVSSNISSLVVDVNQTKTIGASELFWL